MKLLSGRQASVVIFVASALMAGAAFAHVNNTTTRSNTQHNGTAPVSQSCPTGQSWDATTKKCVATDSINYNASKSNTGNVAAPGPTPTAPPAAPK